MRSHHTLHDGHRELVVSGELEVCGQYVLLAQKPTVYYTVTFVTCCRCTLRPSES